MWSSSGQLTTGTPPTEESGPLAWNASLTGYEPKLPDDFHNSETTETFFQEQSSDAVPSYLFDTELDDELIGKALSPPLFVREREEPADRRQAYHSFEEILLTAQSFSVCLKNGETRARTQFAKFMEQRKTKSRLRKRANQDSPWTTERSNSRWLQSKKVKNTSSKPILIREVSRNWVE